jgi:hypothetical protein
MRYWLFNKKTVLVERELSQLAISSRVIKKRVFSLFKAKIFQTNDCEKKKGNAMVA